MLGWFGGAISPLQRLSDLLPFLEHIRKALVVRFKACKIVGRSSTTYHVMKLVLVYIVLINKWVSLVASQVSYSHILIFVLVLLLLSPLSPCFIAYCH